MQNFFGKRKTPEELMKDWRQTLRGQIRDIDKQMRDIQAQEAKCKTDIKNAAKNSSKQAGIRILALELVRSNKAKDRLLTAKTQLNSVTMQLQEQMAMVRISGAIQKSTIVMNSMNSLVKLPQISATMFQLSQEMTKAGLMEEMMNDSFDMMDDLDIDDEEVEFEVNKIIDQVTSGTLTTAKAPPVSTSIKIEKKEAAISDEDEVDAQFSAIQARLQSLK